MQDRGEDLITRLCRLADQAQKAGRQAEAEQLVRLLYEAHDSPSFALRGQAQVERLTV